MPTSAIDSLIFRDIFGSPAIRGVWSDEFRTQKYLDWEAALARAEAKVGLISQEAADEITRVCKVENIDFDAYAKDTLTIGYPVLGLVHQIARLCSGDAGKYCHWGATTQDITDSATILQIKASFDLIAKDLDRAMAATEKLTRDHRSTPMPALIQPRCPRVARRSSPFRTIISLTPSPGSEWRSLWSACSAPLPGKRAGN